MRPRGAALPFLLAALTLLLAAQTATGTRFLVRPGGGGDFPTIQQAVAASSDGDSVILGMGTFRGEGNRDIDFLGKAITIASEGGDPRLCVIDCEGSVDAPRRGFVFQTHEGSGSLLQAIKIVNGYAARGGGMLCKGASPTLRELVLSGNSAQDGGGIACDRASPVIENCAFVRNLVINNGGGILCGVEFGDNSSAIIRNCTFESNDAFAGGGIHCAYSLSHDRGLHIPGEHGGERRRAFLPLCLTRRRFLSLSGEPGDGGRRDLVRGVFESNDHILHDRDERGVLPRGRTL